MKLATVVNGTRDGALVIGVKNGSRLADASSIAPNLQAALDSWTESEPKLRALAQKAENGEIETQAAEAVEFLSPLPRAYEWIDGSAYINHIVLVRKARGAEPPETLETDPLVYQGGSGVFLQPHGPIPLADDSWGLDYEAEICVVLKDTPQACSADDLGKHVALVMLCNDITLRNLIPAELKKGFGFFNGKPATAFSPFAVTPDELGDAWRDGRLHLPLKSYVNDELSGEPDAGPEMHFSFGDLLKHVSKTRSFTAGTILGSGTISNADPAKGVSCLAERRMREIINTGSAETAFLKVGDKVRIEMHDANGNNIFGTIEQQVERA